jgi:DNA-binding transcriptional ArsR family regulator
MSLGIASLNKILKDETRRKIVLLLNEKGSLSYTDLMDSLRITSTGNLNYHLKVLSDLLEKNEASQYMLNEKGKLASRFLVEFPEQDASLQAKRIWWRRFWIAAIVLDSVGLLLVFSLHFWGYLDFAGLVQGLFGFIIALFFVFFFYRMIRPSNKTQTLTEKGQSRTILDILVSGRTLQEVKEEVQRWINEEGISIEVEREGFIRGRLGIPSGLGLTAPKYFEVSLKPDANGVIVHTEGWISLYDVSERSFSKNAAISGRIPRRKGWTVMEHLWGRLRAMSR